MGGICGWIGTGGPVPGPRGRGRDAMLAALAHRGAPAWLDWPSASEADTHPAGGVVADSRFNAPEALNAAWSSWSTDAAAFASRLSGSFAVAALDARRGVLLLARDRLGEKPLYYGRVGNTNVFASELKGLGAFAGFVPRIDRNALAAFIRLDYVPDPSCILHDSPRTR